VKQAAELMALAQESQSLKKALLEMQLALEQRLQELHELRIASEELQTTISQLEQALESLRDFSQKLKEENRQLMELLNSLERERNTWRFASFFAGGVALSLVFAVIFVK
jgi:chromosome segregation ATPase